MANKEEKTDIHKWANSIMLLLLCYFFGKFYDKVDFDHERIGNHETRICLIEHSTPHEPMGGTIFAPKLEAMLPKSLSEESENEKIHH